MSCRLTVRRYSVAGRTTTTRLFVRGPASSSSAMTRPSGAVAAYTPLDAGGRQRAAVAGVLGLGVGEVATRKHPQARLVEVVRQARRLGELLEGAGLLQPEPRRPGCGAAR